jgi:hypothetical protein
VRLLCENLLLKYNGIEIRNISHTKNGNFTRGDENENEHSNAMNYEEALPNVVHSREFIHDDMTSIWQ